MPVAVPWRLDFLGPDSLQVGGQPAGARGADEQVAAEVEIQGGQGGIGFAIGEIHQALVGRLGSRRLGLRAAELQGNAVEILAVVLDVPCQQQRHSGLAIAFFKSACGGGERIGGLAAGEAQVIRGGGEVDQDFIGIFHAQTVAFRRDRTALGGDADARDMGDSLAALAIIERAGHEQLVVADGAGGGAFRTIQRHREVKRAGLGSGVSGNENLVGRADEMCALVFHAVELITDAGDGVLQIQACGGIRWAGPSPSPHRERSPPVGNAARRGWVGKVKRKNRQEPGFAIS